MSLATPDWLTLDNICSALNLKPKTVKEKCRNGAFIYKVVQKNRKNYYYIKFESLPLTIQKRILKEDINFTTSYSEAPEWAKSQADKYLSIIKDAENLRGKELKTFIETWNKDNPDSITSYPSVIKMRRRYYSKGLDGLLAQYGNNSGRSLVKNRYYNYFKELYLKEGAPSLRSCWELTRGFAIREDGIDKTTFPSHTSFKRRLEKELPEQSIYLARYGESAWNRKFGNYIDRDYSSVICGEVWVSDHAQIDVACLTQDGNVVFPWVTIFFNHFIMRSMNLAYLKMSSSIMARTIARKILPADVNLKLKLIRKRLEQCLLN